MAKKLMSEEKQNEKGTCRSTFVPQEASECIRNDMNAEWVKEHIRKYGIEPNIFDGM